MSEYKIDYCHHDSVTTESRQEYIKRAEATSIPVISKEHRKYFNSLDDAYETGWNEALACANMIPSADVVEVVRCKDCRHFQQNVWGKVNGIEIIVGHEMCDFWGDGCKTKEEGYCSYGERK